MLLVLAAGLVISQRLKTASTAPAPQRKALPLAARPAPVPTQNAEATTQATAPATLSSATQTVMGATTKATPTTSGIAAGDRIAQLANAGNPTAETILGLKFLDGQGVAVDQSQAGKWLARAAEQGQPVAQYRLGTMYERGLGFAADPVKAAKWYEAAATRRQPQGDAQSGRHALAEGAGGRKDMAEAVLWFSKAAALGLTDSQFNLAVLYERGDGGYRKA